MFFGGIPCIDSISSPLVRTRGLLYLILQTMATLHHLPGEPISEQLLWICAHCGRKPQLHSLSSPRHRRQVFHRTGSWRVPVVEEGSVAWPEPWDGASALLGESDLRNAYLGRPGPECDTVRSLYEQFRVLHESMLIVLAHEHERPDLPTLWLPLPPGAGDARIRRWLTWRDHAQALEQAAATVTEGLRAITVHLKQRRTEAGDEWLITDRPTIVDAAYICLINALGDTIPGRLGQAIGAVEDIKQLRRWAKKNQR